MARILVPGGTGFLGKHVMRLLVAAGHDATAVSRHTGTDLRDPEAFARIVRDVRPEVVINCAAHVGSVQYVMRQAADVVDDNMQLLLNLYRAVQREAPGATLINPISNCSYPGAADRHCEPHWQDGPVHDSVLSYAMPRRMIHALAECYSRQHGLKSINWLISNAYGPGDYLDPNRVHALNGIIIRLIRAQRAGEKTFEIWGTGKPTREWVYVADAARMLVASIGLREQIYPLNLAQNKAYSIAEIARIAADILGYPVAFTYNTRFADGAPTKILDDQQFRAKYPDFTFTDLREGIRHTIAYYRENLT